MPTLRISATTAGVRDGATRFWYFAEDVARHFLHESREDVEIDWEEVDRATDHFSVRGVKRRRVSRVVEQIRALAEKHHFLESLRIDEDPEG